MHHTNSLEKCSNLAFMALVQEYLHWSRKSWSYKQALDHEGGRRGSSQWGENAKVEKERNKPIKAGSGPGEGEGVM